MNLTKLFNFKYLKQNLKKSKGLLTLITIVVPVITTLMLISYNANSYSSALYSIELSLINIIGMYILPIIISFALCGYVYKRNSVDFINSMPMSRNTIYATNFLAGVIIILCSQIITLIVNIICSLTLAHIFIPIAMVIDVFIYMLIAYIFTYSATILAMTVSGNLLTQIVVTMLIVFLIPFITIVGNGFSGYRDLRLDIGNDVLVVNEVIIPEFTSPFGILSNVLYGESSSLFNETSILKMIILTIIYLILGMYLFNKRKMEDVEKSFSKTWVHLLVKGITLVPMIFIIRAAELEDISLIVAVTLTFIYYIVYDFITNRKVALKITVPIFILSSVLLVGVYEVIDYTNSKILVKNINIDEIASIGIEVDIVGSDSIYRNEELNVKIEDKEIIEKVCINFISNEREQTYYDTVYNNYNYPVFKSVKLNLKNGKEIYLHTSIPFNHYQDVADILLRDEKYKAQYEEMIKFDDIAVIYEGKLLNKEDTLKLKEELNNIKLQNLIINKGEKALYEGIYSRGSGNPTIRFYQYKNHDFRSFYLDKTLTPEIFDIITTALNKEAYEALKEENGVNLYISSSVNPNIETEEYQYNIHFTNNTEILKYIKEHAQDKCDMNKPYYVFNCYGYSLGRGRYVHLNSTPELEKLINTYRMPEYNETQIKYIDEVVYQ